MEIQFDAAEDYANGLLMEYMQILDDWGLNCNKQELSTAIHTLQMFTIKHMLQRLEATGFSEWYGDSTS